MSSCYQKSDHGATVLDPRHPAPIWLIWHYLSLLERFSFLVLSILCVYSLLLAAKVFCLRNSTSVPENLAPIRKRVRNLQQATIAAFYFFGFVLFASLQFAYFQIALTSTPVMSLIVEDFQVHFAFADNVFLVLLIVHSIQWLIANRVVALDSRSRS